MLFRDRRDAGRVLARTVAKLHDLRDAIVLGLPRGGVPVAYGCTRTDLPLDIFIVRKLGVPGQQELAMGAIASGGMVVINSSVVHNLDISSEIIKTVAKREELEIEEIPSRIRNASIDDCRAQIVSALLQKHWNLDHSE
ncbi:hypothetical protein [Tunturiibacter gelidiferens]|uniref:hypothetical protein n=1 Tax=Tunturiibacter gelidiferens TaxID=3069689 RepID=UPI003D9ABF6C